MEEKKTIYEEKLLHAKNGMGILLLTLAAMLISIAAIIFSSIGFSNYIINSLWYSIIIVISIVIFIATFFIFPGLKVINPNEALVLTLFGNYYGTLKEPGFFFVNPFCSGLNPTIKNGISASNSSQHSSTDAAVTVSNTSKKISLKAITLENQKQKVNDQLGNPIDIGAIVIWKVNNTAKAVFNVDNFKTYISIQCDSVIRNVARCYPYDASEVSDEKSLRGSSQEVADIMKKELQQKVEIAGIEIIEVRITHLSYAPEIASAMLQRQQAVAIIEARQKIVEGAVSMVEMALHQLNETNIVELDEERKAAMVSNLLVILCGNKDAQPIINSGSLY